MDDHAAVVMDGEEGIENGAVAIDETVKPVHIDGGEIADTADGGDKGGAADGRAGDQEGAS